MAKPNQQVSPEVAQAIAMGMPKCPICEGQNVRPSHSIGFQDRFASLLRFYPYRCRVCQHRFYNRLGKGMKPPNPWAAAGTAE